VVSCSNTFAEDRELGDKEDVPSNESPLLPSDEEEEGEKTSEIPEKDKSPAADPTLREIVSACPRTFITDICVPPRNDPAIE